MQGLRQIEVNEVVGQHVVDLILAELMLHVLVDVCHEHRLAAGLDILERIGIALVILGSTLLVQSQHACRIDIVERHGLEV